LVPGEQEFRSTNHVPGRIERAASSATAHACDAVTAERITSARAVSAAIDPTASTPARAACAFIGAAAVPSPRRMSHAPTQASLRSTSAAVRILPTSP
jgi:hypothetical protein